MKVKNSKLGKRRKVKDPLGKIKKIIHDSEKTLKLAAEDGGYWLVEAQQSILEDIGKVVKRASGKNSTIKECQKLMASYQEEFEEHKDNEIGRRVLVGNTYFMLQKIIFEGKKLKDVDFSSVVIELQVNSSRTLGQRR